MMTAKNAGLIPNNVPPIYIVSGGVGASGEQLVYTVLAQFPGNKVNVITKRNVRQAEQLESILDEVVKTGGLVVLTLVDEDLRNQMIAMTCQRDVSVIDLMGDILSWLSSTLGRAPLGQPGLYRELNKDYFDRISAIDFAKAHDDGQNPEGWPAAEIVLIGVSRTGKTPLSMYLSVLGWKVANIPLVYGALPSPDIFTLDRRRVIGLTIEPGQLLIHRQQRQKTLGVVGVSDYVDPVKIYEEIQAARNIFRQGGFSVIDVTDKPIETSADEIIRHISRLNKAGQK